MMYLSIIIIITDAFSKYFENYSRKSHDIDFLISEIDQIRSAAFFNSIIRFLTRDLSSSTERCQPIYRGWEPRKQHGPFPDLDASCFYC